MKNEKYTILYEHGNKVLVEWDRKDCFYFPKGVEYSVHTKINNGLYGGMYFKDYEIASNCYLEKTKLDTVVDDIIATYDEFMGTVEVNEGLEYIALNNFVEDWFFTNDSYRMLQKDYENLGIIKEYINLEQYVVYDSLNW